MEEFQHDIIQSLNVLNNDGIILYPTDTIWGIGCNATNEKAIKKIYQLKKRDEKKSMIILLSEINDLKFYVSEPSEIILQFLLESRKPVTAIFENAFNLPDLLINEDGTVAIRIVKDSFCQRLIHQSVVPLVSTSANISGGNYPRNFNDISEEIKNGVDYVVQHRRDDVNIYEPSSIIKLNSEKGIDIIR